MIQELSFKSKSPEDSRVGKQLAYHLEHKYHAAITWSYHGPISRRRCEFDSSNQASVRSLPPDAPFTVALTTCMRTCSCDAIVVLSLRHMIRNFSN